MMIRKVSEVATGFVASAMFLALPTLITAQTTTPPPPAKKPAATTPAKPVAKTAVATTPSTTAKPVAATTTAKPVAATTATPAKLAATPATATTTTGTSASQIVQPASSTNYQTNGVAGQNIVPASSSAGSVSSVPTAASSQRGAVGLQGAGSFLWGDWTAVAYGCFRSGTRVLCDFDTSKQNGQQANANGLWNGLNLVDDGGRLSARHNAFFMGDDGSQFQTGYISQNPVRLLMEYDDVSSTITHATLVLANQRVQNVPITNVDPSQPAGTIPARGAGQAPAAASGAPAAGAPASGTPLDQAQNGVNNAQNTVNNTTNTVNDQKQKAKGLWQSLKGAAQSTTTH